MEDKSVIKQNYIHYINHIIQNNKISHAYLIEISDYENDMSYIYDFVKMILCNLSYEDLKKSKDPVISLIDHDNYPDIKVIEPDGNLLKKSQMIELQKEYSNKSLLDNKRIYIIKNVEKFNSASANTMLKFLEEPEDDIIAILLTNNRYSVIDTILSRCQILSLKEDVLFLPENDIVLELLNCVLKPSEFYIQYNHFINDVIVDKNVAKEHFLEVEEYIICFLNNYYLNEESRNHSIFNLLKKEDSKKLIGIISILEEEIPKLDFNVNYKLWLDSLFSRFTMGG